MLGVRQEEKGERTKRADTYVLRNTKKQAGTRPHSGNVVPLDRPLAGTADSKSPPSVRSKSLPFALVLVELGLHIDS